MKKMQEELDNQVGKTLTMNWQEQPRTDGHIIRFRNHALVLLKNLPSAKGLTDEIERLTVWLKKLDELEDRLAEFSMFLGSLSGLLRGLKGEDKFDSPDHIFDGSGGKDGGLGGRGEFGSADDALAGFTDQLDRLQKLIDSFDVSDEYLEQGRPDDGPVRHDTTVTPFMDGSTIVTTWETDKDGHQVVIRAAMFDDGRIDMTTTTHDFDGHGGTRTERFDGDHTSIREYDSEGRATRKEDSSLSETIESIRQSTQPSDDDHGGGVPAPAPGDGEGSNTGQQPASITRRLQRAMDRSMSVSGILKSYLRGTAHPQWDGEVDFNTGLGPLNEGTFTPIHGSGPGPAGEYVVDPNTGLGPLNIDPSQFKAQTESGYDPEYSIDPNTGTDRPPVHSALGEASAIIFAPVAASDPTAGADAMVVNSPGKTKSDPEKGRQDFQKE